MPGLKFRILLDTKKNEEIFHDILIADGEDFETFFQTIIKSFEFKGDQMASFYVSNETWDKGEEISLLDLTEGEESQVQIMKEVYGCVIVQAYKLVLLAFEKQETVETTSRYVLNN